MLDVLMSQTPLKGPSTMQPMYGSANALTNAHVSLFHMHAIFHIHAHLQPAEVAQPQRRELTQA